MNFFKNINWSPDDYKKAAVLARETGEELLSRLDWMTLKPKVVLDIGCGLGEDSQRLKERYKEAKLFSLDLSFPMLVAAKQLEVSEETKSSQIKYESQHQYLCADALHLPFANQSVDLIFANLMLPWHPSLATILREWRRVIRPNGLLIFTSLGIDTLKEWRSLIDTNVVPSLIDMHDLGDLLMEEKFSDPVLEVDHYTLSYRDKKHLLHELIATGMWIPTDFEYSGSLFETTDQTSPAQMRAADFGQTDFKNSQMEDVLHGLGEDQAKWEVTYEVIYGHAFISAKNEIEEAENEGTIHVSLDAFKRQLKRNASS